MSWIGSWKRNLIVTDLQPNHFNRIISQFGSKYLLNHWKYCRYGWSLHSWSFIASPGDRQETNMTFNNQHYYECYNRKVPWFYTSTHPSDRPEQGFQSHVFTLFPKIQCKLWVLKVFWFSRACVLRWNHFKPICTEGLGNHPAKGKALEIQGPNSSRAEDYSQVYWH